MDQSRTTRAIVPSTDYHNNNPFSPGNLTAVTVHHPPNAALRTIAMAAIALVATNNRLKPTDDYELVILEQQPSPQFQALWDVVETPRGPINVTISVHIDDERFVQAVTVDPRPPEITFDWIVTGFKPPVT